MSALKDLIGCCRWEGIVRWTGYSNMVGFQARVGRSSWCCGRSGRSLYPENQGVVVGGAVQGIVVGGAVQPQPGYEAGWEWWEVKFEASWDWILQKLVFPAK